MSNMSSTSSLDQALVFPLKTSLATLNSLDLGRSQADSVDAMAFVNAKGLRRKKSLSLTDISNLDSYNLLGHSRRTRGLVPENDLGRQVSRGVVKSTRSQTFLGVEGPGGRRSRSHQILTTSTLSIGDMMNSGEYRASGWPLRHLRSPITLSMVRSAEDVRKLRKEGQVQTKARQHWQRLAMFVSLDRGLNLNRIDSRAKDLRARQPFGSSASYKEPRTVHRKVGIVETRPISCGTIPRNPVTIAVQLAGDGNPKNPNRWLSSASEKKEKVVEESVQVKHLGEFQSVPPHSPTQAAGAFASPGPRIPGKKLSMTERTQQLANLIHYQHQRSARRRESEQEQFSGAVALEPH
ncbi:uncharacterized protein LOC143030060 [Oratosquilla oratoria]|uniref:uncharacterized protein LOC143030060 n=1 Tax=Oratosquilla oratoria TaxID=337810 RepID=UPI003F774DC5